MVAHPHIRFLASDIWDTPDDGKRYEVIDGVLYMTPPPNEGHQNAIAKLLYYVLPYVYQRDLGKVYPAPFGVVLDDENGVQPDIIFVARERSGIITDRGVEGAPDLVVEVLSPRTQSRDRGIKMRRYAAAGVPHYWILVPRTRSIEPYRLGERGYERLSVYGPGSVFRPELFPGLEIPVDAIWE